MSTHNSSHTASATLVETSVETDLHIIGRDKIYSKMEFQIGSSFRWKWGNSSDNTIIEIDSIYKIIETYTLIQNSETVLLGPRIENHSAISFSEHNLSTCIETHICYTSTADRKFK